MSNLYGDAVFAKSVFQLQDSWLANCNFIRRTTPNFVGQFCYVIIVILIIFAGHSSDRIKHFVRQNEFCLF